MSKEGIPVLMYHAIVEQPGEDVNYIHVMLEAFRQQMQWLATNGYQTLDAPQLYEQLRKPGADYHPELRPKGGKWVTLTFDDGYLSLLEKVTPILQQHGFRATLFLTTSPGKFNYPPGDRALTWPEIARMHHTCWNIEAHGHEHLEHNRIAADAIHSEITHCREAIEQHLQVTPLYYAFPYGRYNTTTLSQLADNGFKAGFSVHPGLAGKHSDLRRLPRIEINRQDTMVTFQAKVQTGHSTRWKKMKTALTWLIYRNTRIKDILKSFKDKIGTPGN